MIFLNFSIYWGDIAFLAGVTNIHIKFTNKLTMLIAVKLGWSVAETVEMIISG